MLTRVEKHLWKAESLIDPNHTGTLHEHAFMYLISARVLPKMFNMLVVMITSNS